MPNQILTCCIVQIKISYRKLYIIKILVSLNYMYNTIKYSRYK